MLTRFVLRAHDRGMVIEALKTEEKEKGKFQCCRLYSGVVVDREVQGWMQRLTAKVA